MIDTLGSLFFTGIKGTTLSDEEVKFIRDEKIGGVVLFAPNYESPAQLCELVNSIQALRDEYPLFVSVDQEGGRVWRFKDGFTVFPSMLSVAKQGSPKLCYDIHKIIAEELKTCGINVNWSPCCDVLRDNTTQAIGDRAFSKSPEEVSKFVSASIRGMETNGVLSCAKHFPGHGNTTKDSHKDLPILKTPLSELEEVDFVPFQKAIKSRTSFVMVSHLMVDAIDPEYPSSLSAKTYDILRDQFKYKGLIVTDDLSMGAITNHFSAKDIGHKCLSAGADLVMFRDMDQARQALEGLKSEYKSKKLDKKLFDKKLSRVLSLKKSAFSSYQPIYIPEISQKLRTAEALKVLSELESQSSKGPSHKTV